MVWWIGLIIFLVAGIVLTASIFIARYLYKQKDDFWLIYLFPIGWAGLFTICGFVFFILDLFGI